MAHDFAMAWQANQPGSFIRRCRAINFATP
jgi:hypothetical protein